jgi:anti-sigma regulatory factor (Ser/Thr protein kinase)
MEDDGVAFNPLEAPAPRQPGSLAEATVGGLGIHLIRSFTDECRYRRENGRNHLTMVARPRPTASRPT